MNRYLIIEVNPEGELAASCFDYADYDIACAMQEILENLYPDYGYLVYTADEWMHVVENGGHLPA